MADVVALRSPLRRRKVLTAFGWIVAFSLVVVTAIGLASTRPNDWRQFDHRSFAVKRIDAGDLFEIENGSTNVRVHLLGVQAPPLRDASTGEPGHGAEAACSYLKARLTDRAVILRLDSLQTRDGENNLLAYIYLTNVDCLNADAVRDGQVYADRRSAHAYHTQYEQAENEARKKQRGLWRGLTEDQMPAWRRSWLHSLVKDRLN